MLMPGPLPHTPNLAWSICAHGGPPIRLTIAQGCLARCVAAVNHAAVWIAVAAPALALQIVAVGGASAVDVQAGNPGSRKRQGFDGIASSPTPDESSVKASRAEAQQAQRRLLPTLTRHCSLRMTSWRTSRLCIQNTCRRNPCAKRCRTPAVQSAQDRHSRGRQGACMAHMAGGGHGRREEAGQGGRANCSRPSAKKNRHSVAAA